MPDIIRLLPDHIANQIAAGEVIQRPASVAKELLENAIDAGATKIKLIVKEAGKSLIQVIDNGKGMTPTDARLSLERHATSKIERAEDLFAIQTKGFRGEALASIASVAQLEMKTKQAEDELGTRLLITGSKIDVQEPVAALTGTDIAVKKLFFNIPARRKFLKSDNAEFRHIFSEFNNIALAHPDIQLELHHNDKLILNLTAETTLKRVIGVLGKHYKDKLISIEESTEIVDIKGYVGTAESAKKSRGDQYLFINGRYFKSAYFHHAVVGAYSNLIQEGKVPSYVLHLTVNPAQIDVNVHPTKQEIKFTNDREIYNYLKVATRHGLARHHMIPIIDFDEPTPAFLRKSDFSTPRASSQSNSGGYSQPISPKQRPVGWESVFEGLQNKPDTTPMATQSDGFLEQHTSESSVPPSSRTLHGYIVRSTPAGLMLIDQRAAHIRVLFESFMERIDLEKAPTQGLLFPKTLELSPTEASIMDAVIDDLNRLGFDLAPFGQQSYVLHGVPAFHEMIEINEMTIRQILQVLADDAYTGEEIVEKLAEASARSAAISFDKKLSDVEIQHLVEQLFACELPDRTPSGQLCYIILPKEEIDKKFNKR